MGSALMRLGRGVMEFKFSLWRLGFRTCTALAVYLFILEMPARAGFPANAVLRQEEQNCKWLGEAWAANTG